MTMNTIPKHLATDSAPVTHTLAYAMDSGDWDIVETFSAASDEAANAYAEANYAGTEWYVLRNGQNINA